MPNRRWKWGIILYSFFLFFLMAKSARAYVDPGTGSYFFQLAAAGLLSGLFFIKTGTRSLKNFLKKDRSPKKIDKEIDNNKND